MGDSARPDVFDQETLKEHASMTLKIDPRDLLPGGASDLDALAASCGAMARALLTAPRGCRRFPDRRS